MNRIQLRSTSWIGVLILVMVPLLMGGIPMALGDDGGSGGGGGDPAPTSIPPPPAAPCITDLSISYLEGSLQISVYVSAPEAGKWSLTAVTHTGFSPIPSRQVTRPTTFSFSTSIPFPQAGTIGFLTTFSTPEKGILCSDWVTVDTGQPNQPPEIVSFPIILASISIGQEIQLSWEAVDPDGDPMIWSLSWGDDKSTVQLCGQENIFTASHTYTSPGIYLVTLWLEACGEGVGMDVHQFEVEVVP